MNGENMQQQIVVLHIKYDKTDAGAPCDWDYADLLECEVTVLASGEVMPTDRPGVSFMRGDVVKFNHPASPDMIGKIEATSSAKNEVVIKGGSGREYVVKFGDVTEVIYRDWVR